MRSRAWSVLAVTLALMALVAALSSATSRPALDPAAVRAAHQARNVSTPSDRRNMHGQPSPRSAAAHSRSSSARAGRGPSSPPPSHRTGGRAGSSPAAGAEPVITAVHDLGSATSGAGGSPAGNLPVAAPSAGGSGYALTPLTAVTPAGAPPSSGTSAVSGGTSTLASPSASSGASAAASSGSTGSSTPAAAATHTGTVGPTQDASFPVSGGGPISAEATWTGPAALELAISCPDGVSTVRTGASGLSVEANDARAPGTCTVTLAVPPGEFGDAQYRLTVEPAA